MTTFLYVPAENDPFCFLVLDGARPDYLCHDTARAVVLIRNGVPQNLGLAFCMAKLAQREELPITWGLDFSHALGAWALGSLSGSQFVYYAAPGKAHAIRQRNSVIDVEGLGVFPRGAGKMENVPVVRLACVLVARMGGTTHYYEGTP